MKKTKIKEEHLRMLIGRGTVDSDTNEDEMVDDITSFADESN